MKRFLTRTEISLSGSNIWSCPFSLIITREAWKSSIPAFWWVRIDNPLMITRSTRHVFTSWFEHHDKIHKIDSLKKQISIEIFCMIRLWLKLIILGIQGLYVWWHSRFCRVANLSAPHWRRKNGSSESYELKSEAKSDSLRLERIYLALKNMLMILLLILNISIIYYCCF